MGLIVGTGSNAAILMDLNGISASKQNSIQLPQIMDSEHTRIVINTEWSIKGTIAPVREAGLITKWDEQLDHETDDPGFMPFEYMTGGRYLGEIVRLFLFDYFVQQGARKETLPPQLCKRGGLHTNYLSDVLATDMPTELLLTRVQLNLIPADTKQWTWNVERAEIARRTARIVQRRSSYLVAAAVLGALICAGDFITAGDEPTDVQRRMSQGGAQDLIVAYTGGVIAQFPGYLEDVTRAIKNLVQRLSHPQVKQTVELAEVLNGGIIGAGVMAGTVWNIPQHRRGSL